MEGGVVDVGMEGQREGEREGGKKRGREEGEPETSWTLPEPASLLGTHFLQKGSPTKDSTAF